MIFSVSVELQLCPQTIDAPRGLCLGEIWVESRGFMGLLGEGFEIGRLRACHGILARHPVIRIFRRVGRRLGVALRIVRGARAVLLSCHFAVPEFLECSWPKNAVETERVPPRQPIRPESVRNGGTRPVPPLPMLLRLSVTAALLRPRHQ